MPATLNDLLTMYGGSGSKAGLTSNDMTDRSGTGMEGESANASQLLQLAQKYDPSANLKDGQLIFDRSKIPMPSGIDLASFDKGGGKGGNFWDSFSAVNSGEGPGGGKVLDPSKVIHDPNYGDLTYRGNLGAQPGDSTSGFMGQLGKYVPAIISAVMAAGIGAGAGPALGGMISAGMKAGDNLSMGNGLNLESILGSLAGMTGIPGASALTNFIMNEMQRQKGGG